MTSTTYRDLPMADRSMQWDGAAAEKRVRKWAGADEKPNEKYRDAHLWYDSAKPGNYGSYKLLVADVVGGKLEVVPRAVMSAGAVMDGARGGVDLPSEDIAKVKDHLERYYRKMGEEPPWN